MADSRVALSPGVRLGPYEIVAAIGAGGMGEVYRARDTRLDRTVALKILSDTLAADPQFRERFEREARAISQLDHPHICTLFDVGRETLGGPHAIDFLVMAATMVDLLLRPQLVQQAWDYFRTVQTAKEKYQPLIAPDDQPVVTLNAKVMDQYRPEMRKYYYDPAKYPTYLEQLGIKYPTIRTR